MYHGYVMNYEINRALCQRRMNMSFYQRVSTSTLLNEPVQRKRFNERKTNDDRLRYHKTLPSFDHKRYFHGGVDERVELCCEVCSIRTVFKCSGCNIAYYCSRLHQKLDWRKHKRFCKVINRCKIDYSSPSVKSYHGPDDCFIDAKSLQCYEQLVAFVFRALMETGLCVIDNFVHENISDGILYETKATYMAGDFRKEIGGRGDETTWVTGNEKISTNIKILCQTFQSLIRALKLDEQGQGQLTHRSHMQVSCYPKHSKGYPRHVDNPSGDGRLLTTVYHCNRNYERETCGGASRYYLLKTKFVDVEPKMNRAVIHWSDKRIVHETLPCREKLFRLTTWYLDLSKRERPRRPPLSPAQQSYCKTKIFYTDDIINSASILHERFKMYERQRVLLTGLDHNPP